MPVNRMIEGMNAVDASVEAFELDKARMILKDVHDTMPCIADQVHPNHLVRFARQMAMAAFFDQDEMEMAYWGQLARMNHELPWPPLFPEEHPLRETFDYLEDPQVAGPADAAVSPPKGGAVFMDGSLLERPESTIDTPHFIQILDSNGYVTSSMWQDGSLFPEEVFASGGSPPAVPKWYQPPVMDLDPTQPVVISDEELARRRRLEAQAEEEELQAEYRRQQALEAEAKRAERRAAAEERKKRKAEAKAAAIAVAEPEAPGRTAPTEWVGIDFGASEAMAAAEAPAGDSESAVCDDLLTLEPFSLMGKLGAERVACLERRLRYEPRQVERDKISRVLMADAFARDDIHVWEGALHRHLTEIDRSDPDLCYVYARHLAKKGEDYHASAIRWSNHALENALVWEGDMRVEKMYSLHRISAVAAQRLWYQAEDSLSANFSKEAKFKAGFWRSQAKNLAREWLSFAKEAGLDSAAAYDICLQTSGTADYCEVI